MQNKNAVGMLAGMTMMIGGFIGLVWKGVESIVYRFQNPDFTEIRFMMENPQAVIWGIVWAIVCYVGFEIAKYNAGV